MLTGSLMVEFLILGTIEVRTDREALPPRRPQQNAVLAALAVDVGRLVTVDTLVARVWGETAVPQRATRILRSHIAQLRQQLHRLQRTGEPTGEPTAGPTGEPTAGPTGEPTGEPDGTETDFAELVPCGDGYLLDAAPHQVDLHRFRSLLEDARGRGHSPESRVAMLRTALGLWRGEPLAGVSGAWAARVRDHCRQQRVEAVVDWAHAELSAARPSAVVGPVTELSDQYPTVEPLAAVAMRALHALDRSAEALQRYAAVRQRLSDELGVTPGPDLQAAYQAVLSGTTDRPAAPRHPASLTLSSPPAPPTPPPTPPGRTTPAPPRRGVPAPPRRGVPPTSGEAATTPPAGVPSLAPRPAAGPPPAQLPAGVAGFAGRRRHLAELDAMLAGMGEQQSTVLITAIAGTAGVGKTALALHWAHRVADRFPDGQLHVNLRGFDPGGQVMTPAEAIRGFLDALDVPPERIPGSLDAQAALYRSLIAGRRMLILLDNARDADQVRPLLPGTSTSLAIVTSRNQLTALVATDGARPLPLDLLSPTEARELLDRRLGADRVAAEFEAAESIITACARLPLALSIAAARAQLTGFPLASLAAELDATEPDATEPDAIGFDTAALDTATLDAAALDTAALDTATLDAAALDTATLDTAALDAVELRIGGLDTADPEAAEFDTDPAGDAGRDRGGRRLDVLDAGDAATQVRTAFSWSYAALTPPAARMFRLLGLHPGPDISTAAAASLNATATHETRRLLTELCRASLLTEPVPGRYTCHDLLRVYASDLAGSIDPEPVRRAAHARLFDYYVHTAYEAAQLLNPNRDSIPLPLDPPATATVPERFATIEPAIEWLTRERSVLIAAVRRAAEVGFDTHAWQLTWSIDTFLGRRGHWHDLAVVCRTALHSAVRLASLPAQAVTHRILAQASAILGQRTDSHAHFQHALDLYIRIGDQVGQAATNHSIGCLWAQRGEPRKALRHEQKALALAQAAGNLRWQAGALNAIGWCHALLGEYRQAIEFCEQALALQRRNGDRHGESETLDSLGFAHHHLGHHAQAIDCYEQSLALASDFGDRHMEAATAHHLGDTYLATGSPAGARHAWQRALNILTELGDPAAGDILAKLRGLSDPPADGRRPPPPP